MSKMTIELIFELHGSEPNDSISEYLVNEMWAMLKSTSKDLTWHYSPKIFLKFSHTAIEVYDNNDGL